MSQSFNKNYEINPRCKSKEIHFNSVKLRLNMREASEATESVSIRLPL